MEAEVQKPIDSSLDKKSEDECTTGEIKKGLALLVQNIREFFLKWKGKKLEKDDNREGFVGRLMQPEFVIGSHDLDETEQEGEKEGKTYEVLATSGPNSSSRGDIDEHEELPKVEYDEDL